MGANVSKYWNNEDGQGAAPTSSQIVTQPQSTAQTAECETENQDALHSEHASSREDADFLAEKRKLVQQLRDAQTSSPDKTDNPLYSELALAGLRDERQDDDDDLCDSDDSSDNEVTLEAHQADDEDYAPPATKNELRAEQIFMPTITQVAEEEIRLLVRIGKIHSIVDNVVVVEQESETTADDMGKREFDVLDSESLLCTKDGRVIGFVYETFGSVHAPMYSVRFPSAVDIDPAVCQTGESVYFHPYSSNYVLNYTIRNKGSDASNMWDEEVAEDEAEYSDDEQEVLAKRRAKDARRGKPDTETAPLETSDELDPADALLGPLGAFSAHAPSAPHRGQKRKGRGRGRPSDSRAWDAESGAKRARFQGPAAPHFNPRFAEQWMHMPASLYGAPGGAPIFPPMPVPMPMPEHAPWADGYSPHNPAPGAGTQIRTNLPYTPAQPDRKH
ncbi:hypothetical protein MVES1_000338 [Malassezia vespertilionis]|uniref:H/ACA ribonucleoprotein complex non-core subunit NAF1 n=1 Tax=Malassezia vespertilionis TaxID=2020962 RepID=A0A2N1JFJ8_9BASI|nr:uncharacterized protein MVES1_000338 [Malassezia vespertilionis]PKI85320.1 hypothetical protein MVES_000319 [Malassezia vespertilionis]WFD05013.1 hypothetical protein MVES1_000338 [Malassezia vespertilionis]